MLNVKNQENFRNKKNNSLKELHAPVTFHTDHDLELSEELIQRCKEYTEHSRLGTLKTTSFEDVKKECGL